MAGIMWPRVVIWHVLPEVETRLIVVATFDIGLVALSIAGLVPRFRRSATDA
ncbi:MAG: hypothetical protein ACRD0K_18725 [Egibacteraceae bacterium]